jgi:hypothetical protein
MSKPMQTTTSQLNNSAGLGTNYIIYTSPDPKSAVSISKCDKRLNSVFFVRLSLLFQFPLHRFLYIFFVLHLDAYSYSTTT